MEKYEDKDWLKHQYLTLNRSPHDIAKECNVAVIKVFHRLRDFNLLREKYRKIKVKNQPKYKDKSWLFNQHVILKRHISDIAEECNIGYATIKYWLKIFDIPYTRKRLGKYTDKNWLKEQYVDLKKNSPEIAEICRVNKGTICTYLRKYHIKRKKPSYKDKEWLKTQYIDLNKTTTEIAEEIGVANTTISNWLKKLKIPKKSPIEQRLTGNEKYANEEWIKEHYTDVSKPLYEIAKEAETTVATLTKWARRFDIEKKGIYHPVPKHEIYMDETWLYDRYWDKGKTLEEMADESGSNPTTIFNWMKRYNIETRDWSDYKHPSGLEQQFVDFLNENNLPFRYTGFDYNERLDAAGSTHWKNYFIPDFKHETKKIAIELGDKRHKKRMLKNFDTLDEYVIERNKLYSNLGWDVIFVWYNEFKNTPDKVYRKVKNCCVKRIK